jgi:uncharacterized protein YjiS (DUF1127 family)
MLFVFAPQHILVFIRSSRTDEPAGASKRDMNMNIAQKLTNWRKYRETVTELGRMTDRELSDLGIGRADIRRVARTAVGF